jgi:hypothetical protein
MTAEKRETKMTNSKQFQCLVFLGLALATLVHVHPAYGWPEEGRAAISPTLAEAAPGEAVQFKTIMLPKRLQPARPAEEVVWSVNGKPGGGKKIGKIDKKGLYRAPKKAWRGEVHVQAHVPGASNAFLSATVRMRDGELGYTSMERWDAEEIEKSGLVEARALAIDSKGNLMAASRTTGHVLQFSNQGAFLGVFGRNAEGGELAHEELCMVAVDSEGRVFSGDRKTGPPRLEVFDPEGNWLFGFAPKGTTPWRVADPSGIAFHPDGRMFLADADGMRVSIFDKMGKYLRLLREHAVDGNRFNAPSDIGIDASGDLFVPSWYGPCEKLSAESGERISTFAHPAPPEGLMFIDDMCLDQWGNVFLAVRSGADPVESSPDGGGVASVLKFTNNGDFLTEINVSVESPTRAAVGVDGNDLLYIAYCVGEEAGVEIFAQK